MIFDMDTNYNSDHHVFNVLCALLLFPLVPVEEHYNKKNHSQHKQPSNNCNNCNARLHSIGSWLHIRCIVSRGSCIYNSRSNITVRRLLHSISNQAFRSNAMYTIDDLDKRLNHMPGYYFRPTCSIFKKNFNVCSMHVGVLNNSHPSYMQGTDQRLCLP